MSNLNTTVPLPPFFVSPPALFIAFAIGYFAQYKRYTIHKHTHALVYKHTHTHRRRRCRPWPISRHTGLK